MDQFLLTEVHIKNRRAIPKEHVFFKNTETELIVELHFRGNGDCTSIKDDMIIQSIFNLIEFIPAEKGLSAEKVQQIKKILNTL